MLHPDITIFTINKKNFPTKAFASKYRWEAPFKSVNRVEILENKFLGIKDPFPVVAAPGAGGGMPPPGAGSGAADLEGL